MDGLMELRSLITEYIMKNDESDGVGNYLTQLEDDDALLERYLRAREGNAKKAWELLKRYTQNHVEYTEVFPETKSDHIKQLLNSNFYGVLKARDSQGRRVYIFNTPAWDADKVSIEDFTVVVAAIHEATILEDDKNQATGYVIVQNSGGIEMKHVMQYTMHAIRRFINITAFSLPLDMKELIYVNSPSIFNAAISLSKPFLPGGVKILTTTADKGFSELHEIIPKEILPKELGGPLTFQDAVDQNILARAMV